MFNIILHKAFKNYIFERVDDILYTAQESDTEYAKVQNDLNEAIKKLIALAKELQNDKLLHLAGDIEGLANAESGLAAALSYKEGLRESRLIQKELTTFMNGQIDSEGILKNSFLEVI